MSMIVGMVFFPETMEMIDQWFDLIEFESLRNLKKRITQLAQRLIESIRKLDKNND